MNNKFYISYGPQISLRTIKRQISTKYPYEKNKYNSIQTIQEIGSFPPLVAINFFEDIRSD